MRHWAADDPAGALVVGRHGVTDLNLLDQEVADERSGWEALVDHDQRELSSEAVEPDLAGEGLHRRDDDLGAGLVTLRFHDAEVEAGGDLVELVGGLTDEFVAVGEDQRPAGGAADLVGEDHGFPAAGREADELPEDPPRLGGCARVEGFGLVGP